MGESGRNDVGIPLAVDVAESVRLGGVLGTACLGDQVVASPTMGSVVGDSLGKDVVGEGDWAAGIKVKMYVGVTLGAARTRSALSLLHGCAQVHSTAYHFVFRMQHEIIYLRLLWHCG